MLHFVTSYMEQNKSRKQTLESAQSGLEISFNVNDNDNFEIPGYKSTKLIRQNKIGGGICIFTRDDLKVKLRDDLVPENNTGEMEAFFIEIINEKSKNIIAVIIYRLPNNRFNEFDNDLKTILQCGHSNHERYGFIFALFVLFFHLF